MNRPTIDNGWLRYKQLRIRLDQIRCYCRDLDKVMIYLGVDKPITLYCDTVQHIGPLGDSNTYRGAVDLMTALDQHFRSKEAPPRRWTKQELRDAFSADESFADVPEMITRTTKLVVLPPTEPIFSEQATEVEIQDDAAGELVVVRQTYGSNGTNEIRVTPEEWPEVRKAIDQMIGECRPVANGDCANG